MYTFVVYMCIYIYASIYTYICSMSQGALLCSNCGNATRVGKKALMVCGKCRNTQYCNKECQKQHWKHGGYKTMCREPVCSVYFESSCGPLSFQSEAWWGSTASASHFSWKRVWFLAMVWTSKKTSTSYWCVLPMKFNCWRTTRVFPLESSHKKTTSKIWPISAPNKPTLPTSRQPCLAHKQ